MKFYAFGFFLAALPALAFGSGPGAGNRVDEDLQAYETAVAKMKADFGKGPANPRDKEWVKKKLTHMVDVDQFMRKFPFVIYEKQYTEKEKKYFLSKFEGKSRAVDLENTADLQGMLEIYDWFRISVFGEKADENAWLLAQHADHDPEFQKKILGRLEILYKIGETRPGHYAYLFDRVASALDGQGRRKPQRYGTQGNCVAPGKWEPFPIEDPGSVDARRASVGLEALAQYIAGFKDICK